MFIKIKNEIINTKSLMNICIIHDNYSDYTVVLSFSDSYTHIKCVDRQEAEEIIEDIYKQLKE